MGISNLVGPNDELILAQSRFGDLKEGWAIDGDVAQFGQLPTGGNPGGCLWAEDAVHGGTYHYVAPAQFLGNKRSATHLAYDIKWVAAPNVPVFAFDREVEIAGRGTVLYYHPGEPVRNVWVHCVVPFSPSSFWKNKTANRLATASDFQTVLSALSKLAIRGEFGDGYENGYLDNVVMYQQIHTITEKTESPEKTEST